MVDHERKVPYTWGLNKIDSKLGKPDNQELIVLYAPWWTGKTEFTHFVARANADNWVKVCYLSLEMPSHQLALRYAAKRAWIKQYIDLQEKRYTKAQWDLIDEYYDKFIHYNNIAIVWEEKIYTLDDLLSENVESVWLMQEYYDKWYKMFIIDNLGKIEADRDELRSQAMISSQLQKRKNTHNCNIILVHHTSKAKPWQKASMRWNQKIFDNATKVVSLDRDNDPEATAREKCMLNIKQEKNSMRGDYTETECFFDRGVYIEEFVWDAYKSKKILQQAGEVIDEVF